MKILIISGRIPATNMKGDQLVSFNRIKFYLSLNLDIQVICFGNRSNKLDDVLCKKLSEMGVDIKLIKMNRLEALLNLCISLFTKLPFQCAIYESSAFKKEVQKSIKIFKPNFLHCMLIRSFENISNSSLPVFVDMVDSMALNFKRRLDNSRGVKKLILHEEYNRLVAYEKKVAELASHTFVVASADMNFIESAKVTSIPLGVDTEEFKPKKDDNKKLNIIFTGNMSYQPNIDAVVWFINNCFKGIKKEFPDINFNIVGREPHTSIIKLSIVDKSIQVLGDVDSIAYHLNNSSCALAPMQTGSGMQNKILEAMACGIPVVSSSMGLGDIKAIRDKEILISDSALGYTETVIRLLKSKELQEYIGNSGMEYVLQNHNWESVNKNFYNCCLKNL
tara:strand:- start:1314 stop:2489 length:1176 start_codon:yes stop_codon:yes gene_type:complete